MMEVKQCVTCLDVTETLTALLDELSAITDYRTLRDSLPRRLARLLCCRCVLLYQRTGETLQLAAGSFDDSPGWSPALLAVAHINPVRLDSDMLEAQAWRARRAVSAPTGHAQPHYIAVPLLYRQRGTGVLVAIRGNSPSETQPRILSMNASQHDQTLPVNWSSDEVQVVEVIAGVVAMQLENTRLLERDRDRIHELSLLNSISRQINSSLREHERVRGIVAQRAKEISVADMCDCVLLAEKPGATIAWLPPDFQTMLTHYFSEASETNSEPLVLERTGNDRSSNYLKHLSPSIKTFFAIPLWRSRKGEQAAQLRALAYEGAGDNIEQGMHRLRNKPVLSGIIVGAYYHPWKLRREEVEMLSMLANQASGVLENIALLADVVEARNEARKLLRQVLDDQRFKEFILESIPGGLITVDLHGHMTTVNHAAQVMLGYHPYEIIGQPAGKFFPSHILHSVMQSGVSQKETLTISSEQGQDRTLDVTMLPLCDDREQVIGTLVTLSDVTVVRRLEEEKRRLDRLASLGEMAANVAHEVRNPLASIKTSMQMVLDDLVEDIPGVGSDADAEQVDGMRDSVRVVLKEVERLDSIVRDLLLFSRPRSLHPVECSAVEVCERVLSLLAARCAEANVVVHRVYLDAQPALVDVAQLEQVLLNLCINALQSMNEGGILTISCQVKRKTASDVLTQAHSELEIAVSDTGTGIPSDQIERIFQPFYTTKAHGIGLGLPISRRLIEDHHGTLTVESQPGYGATFTIQLPLPGAPLDEQAHVDEEESLS